MDNCRFCKCASKSSLSFGKSPQCATSSDVNAFRSTAQPLWLLSSTVQLTAHYFDSDIEVRQSPIDPSNLDFIVVTLFCLRLLLHLVLNLITNCVEILAFKFHPATSRSCFIPDCRSPPLAPATTPRDPR